MKKSFYFFPFLLLFASCSKDEPYLPDTNKTTPKEVVEPAKVNTRNATLNFSIEKLNKTNDSETTIVQPSFKEGDKIGVFFADSIKNEPYIYHNGEWEGKRISLPEGTSGEITVYYPYQENISGNKLNVDMGIQEDICIGKGSISYDNPDISLELNHLFTKVHININKSEYSGAGLVGTVKIKGGNRTGKYDIFNKGFESLQSGDISINMMQNINTTLSCDIITFPNTSTAGLSISILLDGSERIYALPSSHKWEKGYITTYDIDLAGDYNTPVNLPEYPIDVQYWSNYGKHDKLTIKSENRREDSFSYEMRAVQYGTTFYRNEGNIIKFSASWHNDEEDDTELYYKVILLDNSDNIVEQFPAHKILAESGSNLKYLTRRAFVTAPAGIYRLAVLFRKANWEHWVMAHRRRNCTDDDIKVRVAERGTAPAIRMMWADNNKTDANGIWKMPKNNSFNIDYILANKGKTHLKGQIIAVWERTFKSLGNSFTLASKRLYSNNKTRNDNEWEDEIGRIAVDISPLTKFWRGRIKCSFPIKRVEPQTYESGEWIGFTAPSVHLYFQPEGSNEKIFLGIDGNEIMYDKDEEKSAYNIYKECNFIDIIPYEW